MIRRFLAWANANPKVSIPIAIFIAAIVLYWALQADRENTAALYWSIAAQRSST
jgi:hypothetical protein